MATPRAAAYDVIIEANRRANKRLYFSTARVRDERASTTEPVPGEDEETATSPDAADVKAGEDAGDSSGETQR